MAPLVGYDSSDEDEEVQQQTQPGTAPEPEPKPARDEIQQPRIEPAVEAEAHLATSQPKQPSPSPAPAPAPEPAAAAPQQGPSLPPDSAEIGPSLPPAGSAEGHAYPEDMDQDPDTPGDEQPAPPSSPYTANRSLIHNLTLPTVPNMDIPPSPPGSPSQAAPQAALTAKFDKFLELKRKKGTHFNAKIAESHALKNPPLMDKLLGFVGIDPSFAGDDDDGTAQYATTLSTELWDPAAFPEWAYRGQLRKAQEKVQGERGRERGDAVHFVPAVE